MHRFHYSQVSLDEQAPGVVSGRLVERQPCNFENKAGQCPSELQAINQAMTNLYFTNDAPFDQASWFLSQEIIKKTIESMKYITSTPREVLAAGSQIGAVSSLLQAQYPEARVKTVNLSHPLYIPDGSIELLYAGDSLLFAREHGPALKEWWRILKTGCPLFFYCLGPATLQELTVSFRRKAEGGVVRFMDMHDLGDLLLQQGFADPVMESETLTLEYSSVKTLFAELKALGAKRWMSGQRGLMGKVAWQQALKKYETFKTEDDKIPASFEIIYGHAWKQNPQEFCMPVEKIFLSTKQKT